MFVGETERVPDETGDTEPTPLLIENDVAFVVDHESVEELPDAMDAGFAVSTQFGAEGGGVVTVTEAEHVV